MMMSGYRHKIRGLLQVALACRLRYDVIRARCVHTTSCLCAGNYKDKNAKEQQEEVDNIHQFNQESLVVYGPVKKRLTKTGVKRSNKNGSKGRKFTPIIIKEETTGFSVDNVKAEKFAAEQMGDVARCNVRTFQTYSSTVSPNSNRSEKSEDETNFAEEGENRTEGTKSTSSRCNFPKVFSEIGGVPLLPSESDPSFQSDSLLKQIKGIDKIPSVSTILNETMSEESRRMLENWKRRKIAEMGQEAFDEEMDGIRNRGKNIHKCIENTLNGVPSSELIITPEIEGFWESITDVICDVRDLKANESWIEHPSLYYRGRLDCIARYKDTVCVIDWKTSAKKKRRLEYTYDNPVQLAAYAGAVNAMDSFDVKLNHALLVMMYPDGSPAHAHFMSKNVLEKYWKIWLQRVEKYWTMKLSGT